ncbi:hypothetical protein ACWEU6_37125 [Streptosporangium sandarakinum]|uniref:hypothetical protein n=1 Tax=Streptosporangium sandarakinum TaxID=1260955 RepID=UPI0036AE21CB
MKPLDPLASVTLGRMHYLHAHGHEAAAHGQARTATLWNAYQDGQLLGADLCKALYIAWFESFFPNSYLRTWQWREMFQAAGFARQGRPAGRPQRPITLYRAVGATRLARRLTRRHSKGDIPTPEYGWSWTSSLHDAHQLDAQSLATFGGSRMYTTTAPPAALLAEILPNEWVLDTGTPGLTITPYTHERDQQ